MFTYILQVDKTKAQVYMCGIRIKFDMSVFVVFADTGYFLERYIMSKIENTDRAITKNEQEICTDN